jgi:hypothetical protein
LLLLVLALVLVLVLALVLALVLSQPLSPSPSPPQLMLLSPPRLPGDNKLSHCTPAEPAAALSELLHAATSAAMSNGSLSTVELAQAAEQNSPLIN